MRESEQCIYVIHNKEFNISKIGISTTPERRKMDLQIGCGCLLDVCYTSIYIKDAVYYEGLVHDHFKDKCKMGEWFNIQPEEAIPVIKDVLKAALSDNIINSYNNGLSITKIAKDYGVTRQAIIGKLKRYGVHKTKMTETIITPKQRQAPTPKPINDVLNKTNIYLDDNEIPICKDREMKRIEPNIYYNNEWYKIVLYINKEMKQAYTRDINKAKEFRDTYI